MSGDPTAPDPPATPVPGSAGSPRDPGRPHQGGAGERTAALHLPGAELLRTRVLPRLPPVRLVWIGLVVLVLAGRTQSTPSGATAWAAVLGLSVGLDLLLQFARFGRRVRFPDAALTSGMFLVVLVSPSNVGLGSAPGQLGIVVLAVTASTVVLRHLLRHAGRPWCNPTALGIVLGFVLFALPVPWSIGAWPSGHAPSTKVVELALVVVLGLLLMLRSRNTWRLPVVFFAVALPLQFFLLALQGGLSDPNLPYIVASPVTLFYGLWMVPEPRTAPASPRGMVGYALLVGLAYGLLGAFWELPSAWISSGQSWSAIDPFLALLLGNLFALALRRPSRVPEAPRSSPEPPGRSLMHRTRSDAGAPEAS